MTRTSFRTLCGVLLALGALLGCAGESDSAGDESMSARIAAPMNGGPATNLDPPSESGSDFGNPSSGESATPPGVGSGPASMPSSDDASDEAPASMVGVTPDVTPVPSSSDDDGEAQPGTLTAGAWDDNLNFARFTQYRSKLMQSGMPGVMPTDDEAHVDAHELFAQEQGARQQLDIALMIDTTGSMGDEISYLQQELESISKTIEDAYPDSDQHWALVVYRDTSDAYVTHQIDFTADVDAFRAELNEQSADGGGDLPEAPDAAFIELNRLSWREGEDVARLAFWVADAPHHEQNAESMMDGVLGAQALGVHVYPVASSGIDELTELTMRSSAQLTGGRYLFLTDDSGIGGDHKEPSIPCYFVTRLDNALLRMVDIEMTGEYRGPDPAAVIRTGGKPEDGACQLESGDQVEIF